jgi:hypothetical protein
MRLGIQALAIREAVRTYRKGGKREKWLAFGLVSTTLGLMIASVSVGSFGAQLLMTYMLYGLSIQRPGSSVPALARRPVRRARAAAAPQGARMESVPR